MAIANVWTPELEEEVKAKYLEQMEAYPEEERGKFSSEVVNSLSQDYKIAPNSIRIKLSKAGVYIKKEAAKATTGGAKSSGTGRVSKAAAQAELRAALVDAGISSAMVDEGDDIIEKMTGKAAVYFVSVIRSLTK